MKFERTIKYYFNDPEITRGLTYKSIESNTIYLLCLDTEGLCDRFWRLWVAYRWFPEYKLVFLFKQTPKGTLEDFNIRYSDDILDYFEFDNRVSVQYYTPQDIKKLNELVFQSIDDATLRNKTNCHISDIVSIKIM